MLSEPLLSIVMPAYNAEQYIGTAIQSCLSQSAQEGWELIVINDGSTDTTQLCIERLRDDPRITVLTQANRGISAARNHGIQRAGGRFIAFLDADDFYRPGALEAILQACREHKDGWGLMYADYVRVNELGEVITGIRCHPPLPRPQLYWQLLLPGALPLLPSTVVLSKAAIDAVGGFDERFVTAEDVELWSRVYDRFPVVKLPFATTCRRKHGGQVSLDCAKINHFRDECNLLYLNRHPFSYFCGTDAPSEQAKLAEDFGDRMLANKIPFVRSGIRLYEISLQWQNSLDVKRKLDQALSLAAAAERRSVNPADTRATTTPGKPSAPLLSIVIPAYNAERYIGAAIQSCLVQSAQDGWELIVVDDGSTDQTRQCVEPYLSDSRVTLLQQANAGSAAARNHGIRHASGKFIAFLDADDMYRPDTLKNFLHVCRESADSVALFYCDYERIDDVGAITSLVQVRTPLRRPHLYAQLLLPKALPILTSTVLARKSAIEEAGYFDERFQRCQDLELWTRIIEKFDMAKVNIVATRRRMHGEQVTADRSKIIHWREESNLAFLKRHEFSYFCETESFSEQSRIAEQFGDLMLAAAEPMLRSASCLYEIALRLEATPRVSGKLRQARSLAAQVVHSRGAPCMS